MMSVASLLIHDPEIAPEAREAVAEAFAAPEGAREDLLTSAARLVYATTEAATCEDVREIFGLEGVCD